MSATTLQTIDEARAQVEHIAAQQARLTALLKSPALRTNAHQRAELALQLEDLAVQLIDAKAAVLRAEIAALRAEQDALPDYAAAREAMQVQNAYVMDKLEVELREKKASEWLKFNELSYAYSSIVAQSAEFSRRIGAKQQQLSELTGERNYYNGD